MKTDLHRYFEDAFHSRPGKVFSRLQMIEILQDMFPKFKVGSVVPTDHAERDPKHVNQCSKCDNPSYRILDTDVDGDGKPGKAQYRIRDFKRSLP